MPSFLTGIYSTSPSVQHGPQSSVTIFLYQHWTLQRVAEMTEAAQHGKTAETCVVPYQKTSSIVEDKTTALKREDASQQSVQINAEKIVWIDRTLGSTQEEYNAQVRWGFRYSLCYILLSCLVFLAWMFYLAIQTDVARGCPEWWKFSAGPSVLLCVSVLLIAFTRTSLYERHKRKAFFLLVCTLVILVLTTYTDNDLKC